MKLEDFKKELKEKFPNTPIVYLKDLTKKIAGISKVRIGKYEKRTFFDYAEISLLHINKLGYFYIPDSYEGHPPANPNSIQKQALHYHDLIIAKRSNYRINMGLIAKDHSPFEAIVGNNGMIRVEFHENAKEDTPVYVMQYLKLPFVQEFIHKNSTQLNEQSTGSISITTLQDLPIPAFEECGGQYRDYVHTRLQDVSSLLSIEKKISYIRDNFNNLVLSPDSDLSFNTNVQFSQEVERVHKNAQLIKDIEDQIDTLIDKDDYTAYREYQDSLPF